MSPAEDLCGLRGHFSPCPKVIPSSHNRIMDQSWERTWYLEYAGTVISLGPNPPNLLIPPCTVQLFHCSPPACPSTQLTCSGGFLSTSIPVRKPELCTAAKCFLLIGLGCKLTFFPQTLRWYNTVGFLVNELHLIMFSTNCRK